MSGKIPKERERYFIRLNSGEVCEVSREVYLCYYAGERQERYQRERDIKNGIVSIEAMTDIVSALVGVTEVGLVSNYVLLNTSCNSILGKITEAFTASVGNLNAVGDDQKKYDIFNKLLFITAWLYGFASVGLITVTTPFIKAWIGSNYLIDNITAIAIVAGFYVQGTQFAAYTYRTTLGYFVQSRYVALWSAALNIVLSVVLCKWIGLAGIFIATPIARILGVGITDPFFVYKNAFRKNPFIYYVKYLGYAFLFIIIGIICSFVVSWILVDGWSGVILKAIAVTLIFNLIMTFLFFRTRVFKELVSYVKSIFSKKRG